MNLSEYDYTLPEDLIAQYPAEPSDTSRLMVVHRRGGEIEHRTFRDIVDYLAPADTLVLNRTRVMPARLRGVRPETGGKVEVVLVRPIRPVRPALDTAPDREPAPASWEALLKPSARLAKGTRLELEGGALTATVEDDPGKEIRRVRFDGDADVVRVIEQVGRTPLPPYIHRAPDAEDRDRYQTVYAEEYGAVAAPTAGLHLTALLLDRIRSRGTAVVPVLLHVGPGTFQPIRTDDVADHEMDAEYYRVEAHQAETIQSRRYAGRVVAVGTTTVRVLETLAAGGVVAGRSGGVSGPGGPGLEPRRYEGLTRCFIYPPFEFKLVDALLTNFHLPKSTLLLLVSAFAGRELILSAYEEAVREKYRFYSYGDAMLIV
ncbi:MAG: tRNA preQ1(34) S-adenosylmethionine ribosyltransferase-isomerase QueA [Gemmatimonadetes bacterium]|nr:tRNA preQ1(34) S-adenosylmethionine ribosyltransferase-isomerase QueA [Gemmatimonadota bacterium]MYD26689.1 tRNA preQ1(34) S-adenosylmethionine ribosyltransferase-isomerase QueA [Gemmatimonadota bacterium]MYI98679.1 tRNA preQ1(34) S-adenosylmethionine ribosyltransferase-isomerase QueA [Gemmatimonadota bacterium]